MEDQLNLVKQQLEDTEQNSNNGRLSVQSQNDFKIQEAESEIARLRA